MVKQTKKQVSYWKELTKDEMLANLRKEATGKPHKGQFISADAIKKVRRKYTNKTRWDVDQFDEWLVDLHEEGIIKTAEKDPRTCDENAKKLVRARAWKGAHPHIFERERALMSVRKWMAKRGKGAKKNLATAAMVKTMEMNLKRKTTKEVGAALHNVILAAEGEIIVEDAKRGDGGGKREWVEETMMWAREGIIAGRGGEDAT